MEKLSIKEKIRKLYWMLNRGDASTLQAYRIFIFTAFLITLGLLVMYYFSKN